jgi:hypothetical protein
LSQAGRSRSKPHVQGLSPRLKRLVAAANERRWSTSELRERLGLSAASLSPQLSQLRHLELVDTVTLHDPRGLGRPLECLTLVRLQRHDPAGLQDFEACCVADRAITSAARICGRYDYQLTSFHADLRDADAWRHRLAARPEVGAVEQRRVRTIKSEPRGQIVVDGRDLSRET